MKKLIKNFFYILRKFFLATFIISSVFLYTVLLHINILSTKFMIPIAGFIIILVLLFSLLILRKKNSKKTKFRATIVSVIFSIIFILIGAFLLNTYASIKDIFSNNSSIEYSVMVTKTSDYNDIFDINSKNIGFYKEDKYTEKAENELNKKINANYIGYSSLESLYEALIDQEIDAVMIMSSYIDVIENTENSKIIYTFKVDINHSGNTKDIDINSAFALYISGQDSFSSTVSETSRSDVNMLAIVNLKTKEILLISIPRDYYININGKDSYDKLTHISLYGSDTAANSIGDILDINVDYFIKFNFTTFMNAIEFLLPLDVYSDYDFTTDVYDQTIGNTYSFSKGYNHITTGEMALQFVRARKNFAEGDRQRGINQARLLKAAINKATKPRVLLRYNDILKALNGTFLTNISDDSIMDIMKYVINNNGKYHITNYALDGSDAYRATYSTGSQHVYVMLPDQDTIEIAKSYIQSVLNGESPNMETDASDLIDSNNSKSVTRHPYVEPTPQVDHTIKNTNTEKESIKEEAKEDIKDASVEEIETENKDSKEEDENIEEEEISSEEDEEEEASNTDEESISEKE